MSVFERTVFKAGRVLVLIVILNTGFLLSFATQISQLHKIDEKKYNQTETYLWFTIFQGQVQMKDLDVSDLVNEYNWLFYCSLLVFVFFMSVIMFNILIGIASGEVAALALNAKFIEFRQKVRMVMLYNRNKGHQWLPQCWNSPCWSKLRLPNAIVEFSQSLKDQLAQACFCAFDFFFMDYF